jgi:hypothetical protein
LTENTSRGTLPSETRSAAVPHVADFERDRIDTEGLRTSAQAAPRSKLTVALSMPWPP